MSEILYNICGSEYLDLNSTWNSETLEISRCFQEIGFIWIPCILLWIAIPYELVRIINSKNEKFLLTTIFVLKIIFTFTLIIISACDLIQTMILFFKGFSNSLSIYTPGIQFLTFVIILIVLLIHRLKGIITSGILFFVWLFFTIGGAINYRSVFLKIFHNGEYNGPTESFLFAIRMIYFPIVFIQLILSCFSNSALNQNHDSKNIRCPQSSASFVSNLTLWWANAIIILGYKRSLNEQDIWLLNEDNRAKQNVHRFENVLNQKTLDCKIKIANFTRNKATKIIESQRQNSILFKLLKTYRLNIIKAAILKLLISFLPFVNPIMLNRIIAYMSNDEPKWRGFFYSGIMFISPMIESLISSQYEISIQTIAMRIRTCLLNSIYKKSLRLSSNGRKDFTIGEIVNLMSIDSTRIAEFVLIINDFWSTSLQIAIALYLLWLQLGIASLAGLAVMLFVIPINGYISAKLRLYTNRVMKLKDKRLKLMNEILNGIKVLKLNGWETCFEDRVIERRNEEIRQLTKRAYFQAFMAFIFNSTPFLVAITSFATYVLLDKKNVLTPEKAFVSLALFNLLEFPLNLIPRLISYYAMFVVSIKRINSYMSGHELNGYPITKNSNVFNEPIVVRNASFSWTKDNCVHLKDITVSFPKHKLTAIVGRVGSGKSSLLYAILGEMFKTKGILHTNGSIAYVPQQAWIQNSTLKENIIFTNLLDEQKFKNIIENCALTHDLDILPSKELTEIGEKGITLSGGQKQRVSMARACYSEADIYLLDDPLSALDANVGKHIFDKVIGPNGMLRDKTRILVTHRISVLSQCDQIIVMKDGSISECGSYKQLLKRKGYFAELSLPLVDVREDINQVLENSQMSDKKESVYKKFNTKSERDIELKDKCENITNISKLIETEITETGSVKWTVYWQYCRKIGRMGAMAALLSNMSSSALNVCSSQWLSLWSDDSNDSNYNRTDYHELRNIRIGVYAALGCGESVFLLISTIIVNLSIIKCAQILHYDMINRILRAPLSFFETQLVGRILNRFSKDIDVCDTVLNVYILWAVIQIFRAINALIVIGIGISYMLIAILIIGISYYFIQRLYIPTSRQLKRIESTTRSPIYSHFSETLSGATSIRAYGASHQFIEELNRRVDINNSSSFSSIITSRWLAIRLEFLGYSIIFINAVFVVLFRETLSPGTAGLTLSYAMTITRILNNLVMATTNLETNIVSVERCLEYTRTPMEADWYRDENKPEPNWPQNGLIKFENYSTRYREGLDLVLKNMSFEVNPGERVGVVGRTGAGKSSLTLALFRIIEAVEGCVYVDNIEISKLGLYDLRSRLTIIPQDPVLFTGSLRLNLDPFKTHSDQDIWLALELAHLKAFVASLEAGLSHQVSEGGDNLSVGQKQLLCLARALLRKSRIIVLDEATAAVDIETDELIQATIRKEFMKCTIVTIAHRLNTILDYDKVLVMSRGQIAEYDSPQALLQNTNSIFYSMAKDENLL